MTDIPALAALTLSTLSPFLVKGGEAIFQGMGKDLWTLVKQPFTKDREKALLEKLAADPEDEQTQGAVRYKLEEFLEGHPEFAAEMAALVFAPETQQLAKQISVINSENTVIDSDLKAGGDIIIGGRKNTNSKAE